MLRGAGCTCGFCVGGFFGSEGCVGLVVAGVLGVFGVWGLFVGFSCGWVLGAEVSVVYCGREA